MDSIKTNGSNSPAKLSRRLKIEHVIQRYSDLYDLAPTGYVSLERSGRIGEANLTTAALFGLPRERVIGMPFAVFVFREDATLFLHHLLQCRCSDANVQTELRLKSIKGKVIDVQLCSTPVAASLHNGASIYQTTIIDLTERVRFAKMQQRELEDTQRLQQISAQLVHQEDTQALYEQILDAAMGIMRSDFASIQMLDRGRARGSELRLLASRGFTPEAAKSWEWVRPDAETTCAKAMRTGERCVVSNVQDYKFRAGSADREIYLQTGILAMQTTPLVSRSGKLLGVISTHWRTPHDASERDFRLFDVLARQAADVIDRTQAKQALQEKEAELEQIVTKTPFMLTRCTRDLRYRYVSRAYAQLVGLKSEQIAGKTIVDVLGEEGFRKILPYIEKVLAGHKAEYEMQVSFRGAGKRWLHSVYTPDRGSDGNVIGWFASITDIARRKKAENALRRSKKLLEKRVRERTRELHLANKELQNEIERRKGLEGEILAVSDREQQRLGQELHDGLCQHLTAVAFMARSVAVRLKNHRVIEVNDIEKIAQLVNDAALDTRDLSRALHRLDVDSAGLVSALQDLVDREFWRTPCRLEVKPSFHIEDDIAAAHLYRIAREAVINASKHAQARQIVVKLERSLGRMVMRVTDDGVGLSDEVETTKGLGFHIMDYRARLVGARLEVNRLKTGGTCVSCYLPNHAPRSGKSRRRERDPTGAMLLKVNKRRSKTPPSDKEPSDEP